MKSLKMLVGTAILFCATHAIIWAASTQPQVSRPDLVKEVNAQVAKIDQSIKQGMSYLGISYEFVGGREDAPPSFRFYFTESKEGGPKLRACHISVGHETWREDIAYYFDSNERPLKYRTNYIDLPEDIPGAKDVFAVIYGGKGEVLWTNMVHRPSHRPQEILDLFRQVNKQANNAW